MVHGVSPSSRTPGLNRSLRRERTHGSVGRRARGDSDRPTRCRHRPPGCGRWRQRSLPTVTSVVRHNAHPNRRPGGADDPAARDDPAAPTTQPSATTQPPAATQPTPSTATTAEASTGATHSTTTMNPVVSSGSLPRTGSDNGPLVAAAGALLAVGVVLAPPIANVSSLRNSRTLKSVTARGHRTWGGMLATGCLTPASLRTRR